MGDKKHVVFSVDALELVRSVERTERRAAIAESRSRLALIVGVSAVLACTAVVVAGGAK